MTSFWGAIVFLLGLSMISDAIWRKLHPPRPEVVDLCDPANTKLGAQAARQCRWVISAKFEALKEVDNNDGVVDSNDVVFETLKVWKDLNTDGITDTDELITLNQAGVKSLKVAYTQSIGKDVQGLIA